MIKFIYFFIGYIAAMVAGFIIFKPTKMWKDGWDDAKMMYSDWDKGFEDGWKAAAKYLFKERKD